VETKEWSMFPGVALDKYERSVVDNGASLAMLEGAGPIEDGGRLRKCMFGAGEDSLITRAD
jgi:hypothetical protein